MDANRASSIFFPTFPGVDFDAAWERRVEGVIDVATGQKAFFMSSDDLIAAKLAAGRPQGIADVVAIRKAAEAPQTKKKAPRKPTSPNQ